VVLAPSGAEPPRSLQVEVAPHGTLRWERGGRPELLVMPRRGDGWYVLAQRLCSSRADVRALRAANPRLRNPLRDRPVAVPLEIVEPVLRLELIRSLFPADRRVVGGWQHWVLDPFGGGEESWDWLAELFTGSAETADLLRRANEESGGTDPRRGRVLFIPEPVLQGPFASVVPVATPTPKPTATPVSRPTETPTALPASASFLTYGRDRHGEYAVYRLRAGEALYSAVVVRFTGQLHAADVNATAADVARRSGIADVTAIPIGYPIKVPLDLLLPEHLPGGHPRRLDWEQEKVELAAFVEEVRAIDLSGVHVILDAGHGGKDSGAVSAGLWEASYVYDLACRMKDNLEKHTQATVWMTVRDQSRGCAIVHRDRLDQSRDQVLLTHPPYPVDSSTGLHLRAYLTNDIIRQRLEKGTPLAKIVFLSIHADSLHSSVRGAMAYVPSRSLRPDTYSATGRELRAFAEYRRQPKVTFSPAFKARAEASSRRLASRVIESLRSSGLKVHPYEPIRDSVLRGRRRWVPAVLKYCEAQNAVLLECCNMANEADRANLLDQAWRERFARAVVAGIADAY